MDVLGAEHYTPHARYAVGYSRRSRPATESGPDIDRETFLRKKRHWKKPRHVICPSTWMAEQVRRSTLTQDWPVHVIPNPIDCDVWSPIPSSIAREKLGLPANDIILLFGAGGGTRDHHKGSDLFFAALPRVKKLLNAHGVDRPVRAVVFGEDGPERDEGGSASGVHWAPR